MEHHKRDVVDEDLGCGLNFLEPKNLNKVVDDVEDAAGEDAKQQHQAPLEIGWIGVGGGRGGVAGGGGGGKVCGGRGRGGWGSGGGQGPGDGEPVGHVVTLGEVGEEYVAGGDVALEVFERVRAVELAVTGDLIGHAGLLSVIGVSLGWNAVVVLGNAAIQCLVFGER